jgi:hypothetical protein
VTGPRVRSTRSASRSSPASVARPA